MSTNKSFSTETSERYSRALFEISEESGELNKIEMDIKNFNGNVISFFLMIGGEYNCTTIIEVKDKIKLATIIEHFPDPKLQGYLSKLATEQNLIKDNELASEFDDIIKRLNIQNQRKELASLISKAKKGSLNDKDQNRLKELSKKIK